MIFIKHVLENFDRFYAQKKIEENTNYSSIATHFRRSLITARYLSEREYIVEIQKFSHCL